MATKKKSAAVVIDDTVRALVNSRVDMAIAAAKSEKNKDGDTYFDMLGGPFEKDEVDAIKQLVAERLVTGLVETVDGAIDAVFDTALVFAAEPDEEDPEPEPAPSGRRRFARD